MVGIAAAAAVAGSANAAVVNAAGVGSNCLTFDSSTSTPIVYSGFGTTSGSSLRVGFTVETTPNNAATSTVISGIQFSTVEWSKDNGTTWFKFNSNADSFTTSSTSANAYAVAANDSSNAVLTTMGFLTATSISVNSNTFLVRATMAASVIPNDYKLTAIIALGGNYTTRTSTAVPAPGAFALLGVAGLVGARRRRA